ncbi:LysR family transcriptional regulator [Paenibacillus sp. WLX1005]|uniref:LysR family transcriptional regulator n=1 Tax=Paenibacillus sp. WLX1005 TaxID=3243766 RepID=UPI003983E21A
MELNDLEIFCKVAHTQSMSAAAQQLGYVQSNVTTRIRRLEDELQTPLFQRTPRGVLVLPAGERLLEYAHSILELVQQAKNEFAPSSSQQLPTSLRIGATSTITTGYLAEAVWDRDMALDVYTRPTQQLISMLLADELDGILLNRNWTEARQAVCIFRIHEGIGWIRSASLHVQSDESLAEQLHQLPILIIRDTDCPYRQATMQYTRNHPRYDWNIREVDTLDMMLTLIKQGRGAAILPKTIALHPEHQPHIQWSQPPQNEMPLHVEIGYYEMSKRPPAPFAYTESTPNATIYPNLQHDKQIAALKRLMTSSLQQ